MKKNNFLQLKGYGDFVILVAVLNYLGIDDRARIFISKHLVDLAMVINVRGLSRAEFIELNVLKSGVPALFDIKKQGLKNAVRSLIELSKSLRSQPWQNYIVDNFSVRESFLSFLSSKTLVGIPRQSSIYESYANFFNSTIVDQSSHAASTVRKVSSFKHKRVTIFPRSRIAKKDLSDDTIKTLIETLEKACIAYEIILLPFEAISHQFSGSVKVLEAEFSQVIDEILDSTHVIAADTLACHLATILEIKVFSILNFKNDYYLPPGALRDQMWCLSNNSELSKRLIGFISE